MSPAKHADDVLSLMFSISRLVRSKMFSKGKGNLNWMQIHAMCFLEAHPGATMKDLATSLMVTAPTATSFVNRLVREKIVERSADPGNRKLVRLNLTAGGLRLLHTKIKQKQGAMRGIISALPAHDQHELVRILTTMLESVSRSSP